MLLGFGATGAAMRRRRARVPLRRLTPLKSNARTPSCVQWDAGVQVREAEVPAEMAGWRLDRALAAAIPTLSRERLKALISAGAVEVAGRQVRDPATKVAALAQVSVAVPNPAPAHNEAQEIPLVIAYEDEHLIVVDKPAGLVVHPACGNLDGTLVNALLHHCRGLALGHRRGRTAGHRPPHRQGYIGG